MTDLVCPVFILKAVLLDLDNTLVLFDEPNFYERYFDQIGPFFNDILPANELRLRLFKATSALHRNDGRVSNASFFMDHFARGLKAHRQELWQRFLTFYATAYDRIEVSVTVPDGALAFLEALRASDLKLVLASNPIFPEQVQHKRMGWAGIDPSGFDLVTHIENMSYVKPRVEYYLQVCDMIKMPPQACLMVGNDPVNDMAAARGGLKTYLTDDALRCQAGAMAFTQNTANRSAEQPAPDFSGPLAMVLDAIDRLGTGGR